MEELEEDDSERAIGGWKADRRAVGRSRTGRISHVLFEVTEIMISECRKKVSSLRNPGRIIPHKRYFPNDRIIEVVLEDPAEHHIKYKETEDGDCHPQVNRILITQYGLLVGIFHCCTLGFQVFTNDGAAPWERLRAL